MATTWRDPDDDPDDEASLPSLAPAPPASRYLNRRRAAPRKSDHLRNFLPDQTRDGAADVSDEEDEVERSSATRSGSITITHASRTSAAPQRAVSLPFGPKSTPNGASVAAAEAAAVPAASPTPASFDSAAQHSYPCAFLLSHVRVALDETRLLACWTAVHKHLKTDPQMLSMFSTLLRKDLLGEGMSDAQLNRALTIARKIQSDLSRAALQELYSVFAIRKEAGKSMIAAQDFLQNFPRLAAGSGGRTSVSTCALQ